MNMNMNMNKEEMHKVNGIAIASMAIPVQQFVVGQIEFEDLEISAVSEAVDVVLAEYTQSELIEYIKIFSIYAGVDAEVNGKIDRSTDRDTLVDCLYETYKGYFYKKYPPMSEITECISRPSRRSSKRVRARKNSNKTFKKED